MSLRLRFQRWRLLHGVGPLRLSSPEGARVYVTGIARTLDGEDPFVAPVLGMKAVVALMKYSMKSPGPHRSGNPQPLTFERWHLRPFAVETPLGDVIVDSSHVRLLVPSYAEGGIEEAAVAHGERITAIGSVLRDGIEVASGEQSFREAKISYRLVGNKTHPVVILPTHQKRPPLMNQRHG
jgi:hypothetical protein